MSNSRDFSGKVVIVTGSTSGIGEGIAIHLSQLGANVVITGRREDDVKRVARLCESDSPKHLKPLEVVADVTNDEHVKRLIETTVKTYGQIDVLVNNAGAAQFTTIGDNDLMEKYEKIMRLNVRSVVLLTQLAVPYLEKTKGNIVNISSVGSISPSNLMSVYCMSKAALDMFTKCLAIELGPKAIRVNSVNPGPVESNILVAMGLPAEHSDKFFETYSKATCLGIIGRPLDIAYAVAFLASSDAQFITGSILVDDGGIILKGLPSQQ